MTFVLTGIALLSVAIVWRSVGIGMLAAGPLLLIVSSLDGAGRIAAEAHQFEGRTVRLRIWGIDLEQAEGSAILIKRVWALGAGLHLNAVTPHGSRALHIKVAQPRRSSRSPDALTVGDAKYIEVAGAKVPRVPRTVALEMLLEPQEHAPD